jgi:glycosyltransferase involved in cell wall biosynthesis
MTVRPSDSDLVSVVLIFRDEGRFLDEAIRSVRGQSYDRWELLLVDDGSRDESPAIARSHAEADPERIQYLTHPGHTNQGMSASRNLGIAESKGEYLAFLDGDDVFLPDRLERHIQVFNHVPRAAMVQSEHIRWRSWDKGADSRRHDFARPFFAVGDQILEPPLGLLRILRVPFLVAGICNITVRTEVVREVGGFVDSFSSLYEDQAFVARVTLRHPVYVLQAYLARYRYHAASATRVVAEDGAAGALEADDYARAYYDWLIAFLEAHAGPDRKRTLELVELARSRRARLEPTLRRRLTRRLSGSARATLRRILPDPWMAALVRFDQALDARRGRRAYTSLADDLSHGALEVVPDGNPPRPLHHGLEAQREV